MKWNWPLVDVYKEHFFSVFVYYESIKRALNQRLIFEYRCDARLKAKAEGSTRLDYISKRKKFFFPLKRNTQNRQEGTGYQIPHPDAPDIVQQRRCAIFRTDFKNGMPLSSLDGWCKAHSASIRGGVRPDASIVSRFIVRYLLPFFSSIHPTEVIHYYCGMEARRERNTQKGYRRI